MNGVTSIGPGENAGGDLPSGLTNFLKVENKSATEKAHYDIRVNASPFKEDHLPVNGVAPSIELPQGGKVSVFNRSGKATILVTLTGVSK